MEGGTETAAGSPAASSEEAGGRSLTTYLVAFAAALLLPVVLVAGLLIADYAMTERQRYRDLVLNSARELASDLDREFARIAAMLEALALGTPDAAVFRRQAGDLAARQGMRFVLARRDGVPLADTGRPPGEALPDRPDPAFARSPAGGSFTVSDFLPGEGPREHRFAIVVPVPGADMLLAAVVPVDRLRTILAEPSALPEANAVFLDRNFTVMGRRLSNDPYVGTPTTVLRVDRSQGEGFWSGPGREGFELNGAFVTTAYGWTASFSVPESVISAPLRRFLALLGLACIGTVLACTLAASLVGGRIARPIAALADAARRLGKGMPVGSTRSGIREIDAVGSALEAASSELATRQTRLADSEERLSLALEAGQLGSWDLDLVQQRRVYSARSAAMLGATAGEFQERAAWTRYVHPDDQDRAHAALADAIAGRAPYGVEFRVRLPDREERWVASQAIVLRDATGQAVRVIGIHRDITDRKRMEEALRASEQRLRATQEHAGVGIAEVDAVGRYIAVNEAFVTITKRQREELLGRPLFSFSPGEDTTLDQERFADLVSGKVRGFYNVEKRFVRGDGRAGWVAVSSSAVRDAADRFVYGVRVIQDITDRRLAEESRALLLHELNHRVKNTLATVQSVAMQSFREVADRDARALFESRLLALSKAHDVLTREDWQGAGLREVVREALAPYRDEGAEDRFDVSGPPVRLNPRTALSLAMALHELATNAAKYGALSVAEGRVEVSWSVGRRDGRMLHLHWQESGGPPVTPPRRRGFGSRLIERGLARELEGEVRLDFAPAGVVCLVEVPLENAPRGVASEAAE